LAFADLITLFDEYFPDRAALFRLHFDKTGRFEVPYILDGGLQRAYLRLGH
jgi:hypothetical protein